MASHSSEEELEANAINNLVTLHDAAKQELLSSENSGHDIDELREERKERTKEVMKDREDLMNAAIDPRVADETIPDRHELTDEERRINAATVIQSHYRGYIDRCKFLELLYEQFQKEEEERQKRVAEQVEEGELLVANHQLEVELDDAETVAKNRQRLFESNVVTIQRAWRNYKRLKNLALESNKNVSDTSSTAREPMSPTSQRKNNLLSMAQEFADLKKQFSEALPYNAHKATLLSDSSKESSCSSTTANTPSMENSPSHQKSHSSPKISRNPFSSASKDSLNESDISKLSLLETSTKKTLSTSTSSGTKSVKDAHREDVRKRLAMNTPSEGFYGEMYPRSFLKPTRSQTSMELFVNECNEEAVYQGGNDSDADLVSKQQRLQEEATVAYIQAGPIAKRLIEVEKLAEEPSTIARMLGISTFRSQGEITLTKKRLETLNFPQLQVVFNAYQNEIERLNEELVASVVARDELHMQQDSLLVNIEDQQRRIEELSVKHEKRVEARQSKKASSDRNSPNTTSTTSSISRMSKLFRLGKS